MTDITNNIQCETRLREYIDNFSKEDINWYAFCHGLSIDFIRQFKDRFDQDDEYWQTVFSHGLFETEKQLKEFWGKMWCWMFFYREDAKMISLEFRERYKELIDQSVFKEWSN